jgi:hypothetical protein
MKLNIEYNEDDVKRLVLADLQNKLDVDLKVTDVAFEVITKENWRAEKWEHGRSAHALPKPHVPSW